MKSRFLLILAAAGFLLASCSNDETELADNRSVELRLTSGVEVPQTRTFTPTQETSIAAGEVVSVWVDNASTTPASSLYKAIPFTADGSGNLSNNDTKMHFPSASTKLNIYAIHGNFASSFPQADTDFPTTVTHTVEADQSSATDKANYLKSDLLYAKETGVASTGASNYVKKQELTFYHMLSKVEVALMKGTGNPTLDNAKVTIENTKLKADFTPSKDATMTGQSARADMVKLTESTSNAVTPITIQTVTTNNFDANTSYAEAIVVPQTITKDTPFIKVKLSDGTELVYKITDINGLELKSGNKYTFKITVNLTGLTVTSKIDSWISNDKTGTAEMQ
ncbi:MAG: fimbrillin family protein [Bacteroides sp.]|nr:fimbrillin family protein [Bacteroides sp.]